MRNFQQERGWRNIIQSKPVLTLLGILILFFSYSIFGFWSKMEENSKNRKIVEERVALLKQQKEKLTDDIGSLNTDAGKEKVFRENFGLAKEGEDLIIVVEDKNPTAVPKASSSSGFIYFLKSLFGK